MRLEQLFEKSAKEGVEFIAGHLNDLDDKNIRRLVFAMVEIA